MTAPSHQFIAKGKLVRVFADKRDGGGAAATLAAETISAAIATRGTARLIIGTGNSQTEMIESLVRQPLDWSRIEVFHMDEYIGLSADHPASFRRWLKDNVADVVHPSRVHYLAGDVRDIDAELRRYAELVTGAPIHVCFIGFGENGHIAFNDPHVADFADPLMLKRVRLDERCRLQQVGEGHFPTIASVPAEAITLTCPALMRSEHLICTVPDQRKAKAVAAAIQGPLTPQCPASLVFTHPRADVFLDEHAASAVRHLFGG